MIPPKIKQLPPAPVRSDAPVDFSSKADAMVGALQPFANEANILAEFVNTRAINANASATAVAGVQSAVSADRVLSQQAASNAAGSAAAASSSASTANSRATAAQSSANASEASAVRAETAAEYVEGISGGAAPISNPNFQGVVKVNDVPLGTAATADLTTSNTDVTAGRVLKVRDGGILGPAIQTLLTDINSKGSGFYYVDTTDPDVPAGAITPICVHSQVGSVFGGGLLYDRTDNPKGWLYSVRDGVVAHHLIMTSGNILQTTGTSADFPMSQAAITNAIAKIPSVPKSAAYTVVAADKGKSIDTTAHVTIPASVFAVGDVIVVTNTSTTNSKITPASGVTIRLAGSASTGARTLAGYGVATLRMASNNVWFASGAGLT